LTAVIRPGDSRSQPTKRYIYEVAVPLSRVTSEYRLESGTAKIASSLEVVDGLGRKRATLAQDDDGRWVFGDVALLDARGNSRRTLYPRYVSTGTLKPADLQKTAPGQATRRDALGREIEHDTQLGLVERTEYAPFVQRHWDGAQTIADFSYEQTPTTQTFDGLGRLRTIGWILNGAAVERSFTYDAAGRVLTRRDPEGNLTSFGYDGRGRLISVDEPDAGKNIYVRDAEGDILERHHPDGAITRYTYDLLGRPLTEDWNGDGAPEVTRDYDGGGRLFLGLLSKVTEPSGATAFDYDERQRIIATHHTIDSATYNVGSRFDAQDRLTLHTFPDGSSVRMNRNARGMLSGFGDDIVRFRYEADGSEVRRDYATGVSEQLIFDDDRRLREQIVTGPTNQEIQHLRWTHDAAGNITQIDDLRKGVAPERDLSARYAFDNLYRLTGASGTWGTTAWTYSLNGNITSRTSTVPAENAGIFRYAEHAGPNALTGIGKRKLQYDVRGRLLDDGDRTYTWNGIDRVTNITNAAGASVASVFDAQGSRRIRIETDAQGQKHTTYFIDPWSEVHDGKLVRYLVHHDQRIIRLADSDAGAVPASKQNALNARPSEASAASRSFAMLTANFSSFAIAVALLAMFASAIARLVRERFPARIALAPVFLLAIACAGTSGDSTHGDVEARGSVRTLTDADEILLYDQVGSITASYRLGSGGASATASSAATFPYGTTRFESDVRESRRFANAPRDTGVGVDIMGARAYVPELGVWASPDPALLDDPREYLRSHPSHSAYTYANSNPVALRDDDGEFAFLVAAAVLLGVTFTAAKLEEPQSKGQLAAEMFRSSAQFYTAMSGLRAVGTALMQGPRAAAMFAGQTAAGTVVAETTAPIKEKIVEKATEVSPALGVAVDVTLDAAPAVLRGIGPRKVTAGPKGLTRNQAMAAQKNAAGVPRSQQPSRSWTVHDPTNVRGAGVRDANPRNQGRIYEYQVPQSGGGQRRVYIADHHRDDQHGGIGHVHQGVPKPGATSVEPGGRYTETGNLIPYSSR
jgi:RHS repeat-associated protein